MIFPEAMKDEKEFEKVRKASKGFLLANMTEFGKSKLLNKKERTAATVLYRTLLEAKGLMNSSKPPEIEKTISTKFSNIKDIDLLYFKILTEGSFADLKNLKDKENFRAFIACNIGNVRLIDNMILE